MTPTSASTELTDRPLTTASDSPGFDSATDVTVGHTTPCGPSAGRTGATGTRHALNQEWAGLSGRTCPGHWPTPPGVSTASLGELLAAIRGPAADALLLGLVSRARARDALAGRVVLQAMLGKLCRMARSDRRHDLDDYLAHFWLVLNTYPVERRPARVAANLALDTRKAVHAASVAERPMDPRAVEALADVRSSMLRPAPGDLPTGEQAIGRAVELGLIDRPTARLLRSVYVEGMPSRLAAIRHVSTPESIRWRCSVTLRRLAAASDRLLAA